MVSERLERRTVREINDRDFSARCFILLLMCCGCVYSSCCFVFRLWAFAAFIGLLRRHGGCLSLSSFGLSVLFG